MVAHSLSCDALFCLELQLRIACCGCTGKPMLFMNKVYKGEAILIWTASLTFCQKILDDYALLEGILLWRWIRSCLWSTARASVNPPICRLSAYLFPGYFDFWLVWRADSFEGGGSGRIYDMIIIGFTILCEIELSHMPFIVMFLGVIYKRCPHDSVSF